MTASLLHLFSDHQGYPIYDPSTLKYFIGLGFNLDYSECSFENWFSISTFLSELDRSPRQYLGIEDQ